MGIDVVHLLGGPAGHPHGVSRGVEGALGLGVRRRDVAGITGRAVPHELPVDMRTPRPGVFQLLQDQHPGPLAHDEPVAVLVEGAAGRLGGVHAGGQRLHGGEPRDADGAQRGLGAARQDDVRVVADDRVIGLAQTVQRGGAGRHDAEVRPLGPVHDGHVGRRHVADHHRDEVRADPAGALLHHRLEVVERGLDAALPRSDVDPETIGVHAFGVQLRVLYRQLRGGHRKLDSPVGALGLLAIHPPRRVEVLDLGAERHGAVPQLERRDGADPVPPLPERLPVGVLPRGDGAYGPKARNDHSSHLRFTPRPCRSIR